MGHVTHAACQASFLGGVDAIRLAQALAKSGVDSSCFNVTRTCRFLHTTPWGAQSVDHKVTFIVVTCRQHALYIMYIYIYLIYIIYP